MPPSIGGTDTEVSSRGAGGFCGDFNARCGELRDGHDEMVDRCSVDMVKNEQGEMLVESIKSTGLCFVNGQQGPDEFTCISNKG